MSSSSRAGASSIFAALLVAFAAIVPILWTFGRSPATESPATDVPASTAPAVAETPSEPVTETIVIVPEPIEVDGLPESIVRALEAAGNVRAETGDELGLPPSVINVLAEHDVVLRVAEEEAP